jgi:3-deoxy-D-manno-octulosonic acid (KDO) 8-phosphate synthase
MVAIVFDIMDRASFMYVRCAIHDVDMPGCRYARLGGLRQQSGPAARAAAAVAAAAIAAAGDGDGYGDFGSAGQS